MEKLKHMILSEGKIIGNEVIKVDAFLNHQIDAQLVDEIGEEFFQHFKHKKITKIITIESSGIALALVCALRFKVPMVFVKKTLPSTMADCYTSKVHSFTKNKVYDICVDKLYLDKTDHILFIDDFLANAEAFKGVEDIINQSQAKIEGIGIVIEKSFQKGHQYIIDKGYDLHCLASIESINNNQIKFTKQKAE